MFYVHNDHTIISGSNFTRRYHVTVWERDANYAYDTPIYTTVSLLDAFKWSDQVTAAAAALAASDKRQLPFWG